MSVRKAIEDTALWKGLGNAQKAIIIVTNLLAAVLIAVGVFMRYLLHKDFFGQEEVVTVVAMWLYFIGGVHGSYTDSHIQADIMGTMIKKEKAKKLLNIIVKAISVVVLVMFTKFSYDYAIWSFQSGATSAGLKIPLIYSQVALAIGFTFMLLFTIYQLVRAIKPRKVESPSEVEEGGAEA